MGDDVDRQREVPAAAAAEDPGPLGARELLRAPAFGQRVELVARRACSFVSFAGRPAASNLTEPSTIAPPSARPIGPGQRTWTVRPAIRDAIADNRASLPTRSARSSTHHAVAASSTADTDSFSHSGVVG